MCTSTMNVQDIPSSALLISNFPNVLNKEDLCEFLKHFNVKECKILSKDSKKSRLVHARFDSKTSAKAALLRLHQLNVLGNRLKVEFTSTEVHGNALSDGDSNFTIGKKEQSEADKGLQYQEAFLRSLTAWTSTLDLNHPPPHHLHYLYPPPNSKTLKNISETLAAHPHLYTQLLHLMNRMNLPPPFEDDRPSEIATQTEEGWFIRESSEESEYESDHEEDNLISRTADKIAGALKRPANKRVRKSLPLIKRARLSLTNPATQASTRTTPAIRPEEVFEKSDAVAQKKIEMRLASTPTVGQVTTTLESDTTGDVGSFGLLYPTKDTTSNQDVDPKAATSDDDTTDSGGFITSDQLAQNRLPAKDLKVLPLFQNYQPGAPSCRLYIKNLAKKVESKDLHFIYRRYLNMATPEQAVMFDIRLMTEGRMKGQAFVTLPTKELALQAVQETNGFILKDKPLCVQFARSAPTGSSGSASGLK